METNYLYIEGGRNRGKYAGKAGWERLNKERGERDDEGEGRRHRHRKAA